MRGLSLVTLVCTGCASWSGASSVAMPNFPRRDELRQVLQQPPAIDVKRFDAAEVDEWTLEGPFPTGAGVEVHAAATAWERALAAAAPASTLTAEETCVARETGRFHLAHQASPGHSLAAFIEARCGSTAGRVAVSLLAGQVPADVDDATWLREWQDGLTKGVQGLGEKELLGAWAGREQGRAVLVLAAASPAARFSAPVPLVPAGRAGVVVRGRLARAGAERIDALINEGAIGVQRCQTLDALAPPDFAFECPLSSADERTTLQLAAFEPGRILGATVASFLLWPAGSPSNVWRRPRGGGDATRDDFAARFLAAVNALRTSAGLGALAEVPKQSAVAAALAPYYFAAGDAADADRIALGMMAGWDVEMDVVSAGFGSEVLTGTRDVQVLLDFVLASPFGRRSLTEPRATQIAVGPFFVDGASVTGAIFATYVPLGTFVRKDAETAVITRLNRLRLDRQLGLAQWTLWPVDESAVVQQNLASRSWGPEHALQYVLRRTADVAKGAVTGSVQLVDDLEHFQFPPEVLQRKNINVFLSVGTYRAADWPHVRYVVCFVVASREDVEVASR